MLKKKLVIALDGPSGAGKSTVARLLAQQLGYIYIDTGAMYRAIGWKAKREGIDPTDERRLADLCLRTEVLLKNDDSDPKVFVDGKDVSGEIRTPEMGMMASSVSKSPAVRARLLALQRELGKSGGVVMDGRDIGTVVFPDAEVKFFLDASAEERGRRRYLELRAKGMDVDLARITKEIQDRDKQDSGRALAPLRKAEDALLLDTTRMSIDDVLSAMLSVVNEVR
ncbi:MAG TPA: (d)CMP kinase [Nitrospirota bacterium]|nr:(d)CMP kinase [Nitrospirota bacterium]